MEFLHNHSFIYIPSYHNVLSWLYKKFPNILIGHSRLSMSVKDDDFPLNGKSTNRIKKINFGNQIRNFIFIKYCHHCPIKRSDVPNMENKFSFNCHFVSFFCNIFSNLMKYNPMYISSIKRKGIHYSHCYITHYENRNKKLWPIAIEGQVTEFLVFSFPIPFSNKFWW